MLLFCVYQPNVTSSSRRPSPGSSGGSGGSTASPHPAASMGTTASSKLGPAQASSGGSGSSTASPPPAASMGTTASSKLGPAQGESSRTRCMHELPTDCVHGFVEKQDRGKRRSKLTGK
ncbi:hypothetical protein PR001_g3891 [Phytophthora rubi]|uniref:Uncharacterized protein n=1 Tax=Phytophthora rubi TaxID=129364 RepID=A0A6A3P3J2_9STRA|nr:hypothetical protein PR001_g3891 [Phytophthora rubi]